MYYIDSNIFILAANKSALLHHNCQQFLKKINKESLAVTTSFETVQEIIHACRGYLNNRLGIKICQNILKIISEPLIINHEVITTYLKYAKKYENVDSQDLIHLACCVVYGIDRVVTYDKHFDKFKEIRTLKPEEI